MSPTWYWSGWPSVLVHANTGTVLRDSLRGFQMSGELMSSSGDSEEEWRRVKVLDWEDGIVNA